MHAISRCARHISSACHGTHNPKELRCDDLIIKLQFLGVMKPLTRPWGQD